MVCLFNGPGRGRGEAEAKVPRWALPGVVSGTVLHRLA